MKVLPINTPRIGTRVFGSNESLQHAIAQGGIWTFLGEQESRYLVVDQDMSDVGTTLFDFIYPVEEFPLGEALSFRQIFSALDCGYTLVHGSNGKEYKLDDPHAILYRDEGHKYGPYVYECGYDISSMEEVYFENWFIYEGTQFKRRFWTRDEYLLWAVNTPGAIVRVRQPKDDNGYLWFPATILFDMETDEYFDMVQPLKDFEGAVMYFDGEISPPFDFVKGEDDGN